MQDQKWIRILCLLMCVAMVENTNCTNSSTNNDSNCSIVCIQGCIEIDTNNSLGLANNSNCGCKTCDSGYDINANQTCVACNTIIANCATCINVIVSPICTACEPNYELNSTTFQCDICNKSCTAVPIDGCIQLDVNNTLLSCNTNSCGCLACNNSFDKNGSFNCVACNTLIPNCITCINITVNPICTACISTYELNSSNQCDLCNKNCTAVPIDGCIQLDINNTLLSCDTSSCRCLVCNTTYGITANNSCVTCSTFATNCSACINITTNPVCTACDPTYELNSATFQCELCNKPCTSVPLDGCIQLDVNNTLLSCNTSSCGCLVCNTTYGMNVNHTCVPCNTVLTNCSTCANIITNPVCTLCDPTYEVNSTTFQCEFCNKSCTALPINGCAQLDVNNTLLSCNTSSCGCLACNATFDMDANHTCVPCNTLLSNCSTCINIITSPTCTACEPNYELNSTTHHCDICNKSCTAVPIDGCIQLDVNNTLLSCNTNSCGCLACNSTSALDVNHTCVLCSTIFTNCTSCTNIIGSPTCTSCDPTYEVNSTTHHCQLCNRSCSAILINGCSQLDVNNTLLFCNTSRCGCLQCQPTFYMNGSLNCVACNTLIPNCSTCVNVTVNPTCTSCAVTHQLNSSNQCQLCNKPCTAVPIYACFKLDVNNSLFSCNTSNCRCLVCNSTYDLDVNYNCVSCVTLIPNCRICSNTRISTICNFCVGTYYLNTTSNSCLSCSTLYFGCLYCSFTVSYCQTCQWSYWFNATNQSCQPCNVINRCSWCYNGTVEGCWRCNGLYGFDYNHSCVLCSTYLQYCAYCIDVTACDYCHGYANIFMYNNSRCGPCWNSISYCKTCISNVSCTTCNVSYMGLNNNSIPNSCEFCNISVPNCYNCTIINFCLGCVSNAFILFFIDLSNQICLPCSNFLAGCQTCKNASYCLSCFNNSLYLYDPAFSSCVACDHFLNYCLTCTPTYHCLSCNGNRYVLTHGMVCQPCSLFMVSCLYCNSTSICTLCSQGKLLADKTGCTKITGCIEVDPLRPITNNCLKCDALFFEEIPKNGRCACLHGWTVGGYCTTIYGCTALIMKENYVTQCVSCDITQNFLLSSKTCICMEHYYFSSSNTCKQICGDGYVITLACDDGNLIDGDGCSSTCEIEAFHTCENDNSRYPSSKCQFRAKISVTLNSIYKTIQPNSAKAIFDISPFSKKMNEMQLASLVTLNASWCNVAKIEIVGHQLMVYFFYNATIEHESAEINMDFDHEYVKSPQAKTSFLMIQSLGIPLVYKKNNQFNKTIESMITTLGLVSLVVFAFCSIAYKMIAVETIYTIQIVCILQAVSKYYQSYFANFEKLHYAYGQISSYSGGSQSVSNNFSRLGFTQNLNQNYLLFIVINEIAIFIYVGIALLRLKLKLQIFKDETLKQHQISSSIKRINHDLEVKIKRLNQMLRILYDWVLFPLFIGVLAHLIHTVMINQHDSYNKKTPFYHFFSIISSFVAASLIFHTELLGNHCKHQNILEDPKKNLYIPYFLVHNFGLFFLLTLTLIKQSQAYYYVVIVCVVVHCLYLMGKCPYKNNLSNFSIIFNQLFILFTIFWLLIKGGELDTEQSSFLFCYSFIILGFVVNLLGVVRSVFILKEKYWDKMNEKVIDDDKQPMRKNKKQMESIDFSQLKFNFEESNVFTNMLTQTKPNFDEVPLESAALTIKKESNQKTVKRKSRRSQHQGNYFKNKYRQRLENQN